MRSKITDSDIRGFLGAFFITLATLSGAASVYFLSNVDDFPPPRLSDSESFDFKARWLRGAIADGRCDTLIIGSSMALNNFYYPVFARTNQAKVVNLGSFNMGVEMADKMLSTTLSVCTPSLILYPIYHGDLNSDSRFIDWETFTKYISGRPALPIYIRTFDPKSLLNQMKDTRDRRLQGGRVYQSLDFDTSGTVNLSADNFAVDQKRWEGYRAKPVLPASQGALHALSHILDTASEKGVRVVVATVPMRQAAEQHFGKTTLNGVWGQVGDKVAERGGKFVRIDNDQRFPDSMYVDFTHLNERGAATWTQIMLDQSREIIARALDRPRV